MAGLEIPEIEKIAMFWLMIMLAPAVSSARDIALGLALLARRAG